MQPRSGRASIGRNLSEHRRAEKAEIKSKLRGSTRTVQLANHGSKFFFVPFFIFHYGLFCWSTASLCSRSSVTNHSAFGPFGPLGNLGQVFAEQRLWWA